MKQEKKVISKSGRELSLTEGMKSSILKLVKEGKELKEIAETLQISKDTLANWKYDVITQEWNNADMYYQLSLAEQFSKRLMSETAGKKDTGLKAIQQKEAEFLRKQLLNAKAKYNDAPTIAIQVNLPSPIIDLGKLDSEQS